MNSLRKLGSISKCKGSTVKVLVPPGWRASVTAVTRQPYNQLVACGWQEGQTIRSCLLVNTWQTPYVPMVDPSDGVTAQVDLSSHNVPSELTLEAYHSQIQAVNNAALRDDQYRSYQVKVSDVSPFFSSPPSYLLTSIVDQGTFHQWRCTIGIYYIACLYDVVLAKVLPNLHVHQILVEDAAPSGVAPPQFDDLPGLPKTVEYFYYFSIDTMRSSSFRQTFKSFIVPKITSCLTLTSQQHQPQDFVGLNVGFTPVGLLSMNLRMYDVKDASFSTGQYADSKALGDAGTTRGTSWSPDWDPEFKKSIDGVFIITAFTETAADSFVRRMEGEFSYSASMKKIVLVKCKLRPGDQAQNDHFGYRGGISNPQIQGATFDIPAQPEMRYPGSPVIPMGVIVTGYTGDPNKDTRASWTRDGAFMVTRHLNLLVPEFEAFLLERGPKIFAHISIQAAADHLGARLFGRWKDGTPTELSPDGPDPRISGDDKRVNNFTFDQSAAQTRCPFAAHIRKSTPRGDVPATITTRFIRRQGISFGPEVTQEERNTSATSNSRGLHFVCYASSIVNTFKYQQCSRYNDTMFPPNKDITPGMDPIVGQTGEEQEGDYRFMTGADPSDGLRVIIFPEKFAVPRGGAYFFVPSISALRNLRA
ncbi:hypothetical protein DXG01_016068 [Tephrocybe rancida]|nr:hypothetical protein DXG01_016068 [Tephrocybe rancida]